LLLGTPLRCSCIALLPSIHGHMQNLHFHRPWRSDAGASPMDGGYLLLQYPHFLHPCRSVHCVSQQVVTDSCLGLYNHGLMPTISPFAYNNIFFNGTAVCFYLCSGCDFCWICSGVMSFQAGNRASAYIFSRV
jgi:hypothetical protein